MNGSRQNTRGRPTTVSPLVALGIVAIVAGGVVTSGEDTGLPSATGAGPSGVDNRSPAAYRVGGNAAPRVVLHYRGTLSGALVPDSSGTANAGEIRSGRGGGVISARSGADPGGHPAQGDAGHTDLRAGDRDGDRYLRFPGRECAPRSNCPWAVVLPRRDLALEDAETAAFAFGAWVRLTSQPGNGGMTVIQRGTGAAGEAQWSLRVDDGRVSCRWSDGAHAAVLPDDLGRSMPLQVDRWYGLSCSRQGARFSLTVVDPVTTWPIARFTRAADDVGLIAAHGDTTIGATAPGGDTDSVTAWFRGDLDEIMVRAG